MLQAKHTPSEARSPSNKGIITQIFNSHCLLGSVYCGGNLKGGNMQKKSFNTPDETRTPSKTKVEVVEIADRTLLRTTFDPGWKWSVDVKPTVATDSCEVHHIICALSGRINVRMDDGTEMEVGPGDVADIPPGHNAWVVGDEPAVGIDLGGGSYGKPAG